MAKGFTLTDFAITFVGRVVGIVMMAAALSRFMFIEMNMKRWVSFAAELLLIAPGRTGTLIGIALSAPVVMSQWGRHRQGLGQSAA